MRPVGVAAGTAVAVGAVGLGLYWLYSRAAGGNGWGFGLGGGGGDSILGIHPPGGPASSEGGDGGTASEPGGGQANSGGAGGHGGQGGASSGSGQGGKPSGGSGGTGGSGGDSGGGGQGGGGVGGGSGGGVGQGSGSGTAGGEDEGGSTGDDNGGGADEGHYDPWGGALIDADLPPPDLSAGKLSAVRQTVEDLVLGAVLDPGASSPGLPAPLHTFNPWPRSRGLPSRSSMPGCRSATTPMATRSPASSGGASTPTASLVFLPSSRRSARRRLGPSRCGGRSASSRRSSERYPGGPGRRSAGLHREPRSCASAVTSRGG